MTAHQTQVSIHRRRQVETRVGLSRSTIYDLIAKGLFPRPVQIGARSVGWRSDEIDAWIESQTESSRATRS